MVYRTRIVAYLFPLIILVLIFSSLTGCNNSQSSRRENINSQSVEVPANTSANQNSFIIYKDTIASTLLTRLHTEIDSINITYTKETDTKGYISQIIFKTKTNKFYEGAVYATSDSLGKWVINDLSYSIIKKDIPFTQSEMSGPTSDQGSYFIISGIVNDMRVSYINVSFVDGALVQIIVNPSFGTYAYVRIDSPIGVKEICGYSKNDSLIYKY